MEMFAGYGLLIDWLIDLKNEKNNLRTDRLNLDK